MSINPTIIVSLDSFPANIHTNVAHKIAREFDTNGEDSELLQLVDTVALAPDSIKDKHGNTLKADGPGLNGEGGLEEVYSNLQQAYFGKQPLPFSEAVKSVVSKVQDLQVQDEVDKNTGYKINRRVKIVITLPIYDKLGSVFLILLLKHWSDFLDTMDQYTDYEITLALLFPDLKEEAPTEQEHARAYATICEIDHITASNLADFNSILLLSSQNNNGQNVVNLNVAEEIPAELAFQSLSNSNYIQQGLANPIDQRVGDTYGKYSSFGICRYRFSRDVLLKRLRELSKVYFFSVLYKKITGLKFDINEINSHVRSTIENNNWEDEETLFGVDFQTFKNYIDNAEDQVVPEVYNQQAFDQFKKNVSEYNSKYENEFNREFFAQLNESVQRQIKNARDVIQQFVLEKLRAEDPSALMYVMAYLHCLVNNGREANILTGNLVSAEKNLETLERKALNYFKDQQEEQDERVDENNLRVLINDIDQLREDRRAYIRQIRELQERTYNLKEIEDNQLEDQKSERTKYFVLDNDKKVDITGHIPDEPEIALNGLTWFKIENHEDQLPRTIDLRASMPPVKDQGQAGTCTANAVINAYEYLVNRANNELQYYSRRFLYYNARRLNGQVPTSDSGSSIRACLQSLMNHGVCLENVWKYDPDDADKKPEQDAYNEAANHKAYAGTYIDIDLTKMKACLAQGYPFVFGLKTFESFRKVSNAGMVPNPRYYNEDPNDEDSHGSHAMLCVGYSEADEFFIVKNSWGARWGDRGYCYISFDHMSDPELHSNGFVYAITKVMEAEQVDDSQGPDLTDAYRLFHFGNEAEELNELLADFKKINDQLNQKIKEHKEKENKLREEDRQINAEFKEKCKQKELKKNQEDIKEQDRLIQGIIEEYQEKEQNYEKEKRRADRKKWKALGLGVLALILELLVYPYLALFYLPDLLPLDLIWYLSISSTLIAAVVVLVYLYLKFSVKRSVDKARSERNEKGNQIKQALNEHLGLYEYYYDIQKKYARLRVYLEQFIYEIESYVLNDLLNNHFDRWIQLVEIESDQEQFESINKHNAVDEYGLNIDNIHAIGAKAGSFHEFSNQGNLSLYQYLVREENSNHTIDAERGFERLTEELSQFINDRFSAFELNNIDIYDLLFGNNEIVETGYQYQGVIRRMARSASPLITLHAPDGNDNYLSQLYLLLPNNQNRSEEEETLKQCTQEQALGQHESLQADHARNQDEIVVMRLISGFPSHHIAKVQGWKPHYENARYNGDDQLLLTQTYEH